MRHSMFLHVWKAFGYEKDKNNDNKDISDYMMINENTFPATV